MLEAPNIDPRIEIRRGVVLTLHTQQDQAYLKLPRKRKYVDRSQDYGSRAIVDLNYVGIQFLKCSAGVELSSLPLSDRLKGTLAMVFSQIGVPLIDSKRQSVTP